MRIPLAFGLMLLLVAGANAAPDPTLSQPQHGTSDYPAYGARDGGENIATAIVIPGNVSLLPYHDTGNTCDHVNDYEETCPYTGSTAPDVVYSFTPSENVTVNVDLCASVYDTKVYVYDAFQVVVACNDDGGCGYSGWQSYIEEVALTGGATYYVVIDGYGSTCGGYDLTLARRVECVLECPSGAFVEGEPPCGDGYVDDFNSGCNPACLCWSVILAGPDGCATVCGKSCTYVFNGLGYRDTDWYEGTASGLVTFSCTAEFPVRIYLHPDDCNLPLFYEANASPCEPAQLSWNFPPGSRFWMLVRPSVLQGVPESDYVFTVCGLEPGPTPVKETSWGRIKSRYRQQVE